MDLDVIRKQIRLGKPLGDRGFLEMISKKLGYKLYFRSKGRSKTGYVPKYSQELILVLLWDFIFDVFLNSLCNLFTGCFQAIRKKYVHYVVNRYYFANTCIF